MAHCKKKKKNLKYLLIAKVIVPITTGASRLTALGPGARLRAPGGGRGSEAPRSFWVLAVLEPQQGPFQRVLNELTKMHIQQFLTLLKCHYTYKYSKSSDIILDQSNPINSIHLQAM